MLGTLAFSMGLTVAVLLIYAALLTKRVNDRGGCPNCGTPVPQFRPPTSWRQALWGGWTCTGCRTEMDRNGRQLPVKGLR